MAVPCSAWRRLCSSPVDPVQPPTPPERRSPASCLAMRPIPLQVFVRRPACNATRTLRPCRQGRSGFDVQMSGPSEGWGTCACRSTSLCRPRATERLRRSADPLSGGATRRQAHDRRFDGRRPPRIPGCCASRPPSRGYSRTETNHGCAACRRPGDHASRPLCGRGFSPAQPPRRTSSKCVSPCLATSHRKSQPQTQGRRGRVLPRMPGCRCAPDHVRGDRRPMPLLRQSGAPSPASEVL